ncbi:MAG: hypothetical protein ACHQ50_00350 [Fimbriimonadales bacterium]
MGRRSSLAWIMGILVLACLIAVAGRFISPRKSRGSMDLAREIELAKKDGIPLEPADLRPKQAIPDSQNAAVVYKAAFPAILDIFSWSHQRGKELVKVEMGRATSAEKADLESGLLKARKAMDQVSSAAGLPECEWPSTDQKAFTSSLLQATDVVKVFDIKARLLIDHGRIEEAYDAIATEGAIGRQAGMSPGKIAAMVEALIGGTAMNGFLVALQKSAGDRVLLTKAQRTLARFSRSIDLRAVYRAETVARLSSVREIHTEGDVECLTIWPRHGTAAETYAFFKATAGKGPVVPREVVAGYEAKFLASWRRLIETLPSDPTDLAGANDAIDKVVDSADKDTSPDNIVNRALLRLPGLHFREGGYVAAFWNLAATSIRLMQGRIESGTYPESLPDYGKMAIDPFTGKRLEYHRQGAGFELSSAGDLDRPGHHANPKARRPWTFG